MVAELRGAVVKLEALLASTEGLRAVAVEEKAQLQALVASQAAEAERLGAQLQRYEQRIEELVAQSEAASARVAVKHWWSLLP